MSCFLGEGRRGSLVIGLLAVALGAPAQAGRTIDRLYLFGDDGRENATPGTEVSSGSPDAPFNAGTTIDSEGVLGGQQVVNLEGAFGFGPSYVAITDRPDGQSGVGVLFDGNGSSTFDHLQGARLGTPQTSISDLSAGGSLDYFFVLDRGMQFWTKPTAVPTSGDSADDVHLVMDTNNHGALINANGRYTMRYNYADSENGGDFEGQGDAAIATPDEWAHIMVVRPDRTNPYSAMYVNGVAVAAKAGDYLRGTPLGGSVNDAPDTAPLVVGAATEPASGFSQGFANNYNGVIDDLEMFVLGLSPAGDYGEFDFATDNAYAVSFGPAMPLDLANDDGAITYDDIDVFVDNWLYEKRVNDVLLGDLETVARGDFDYSGRVDIADWQILNAANPELAAAALAQIVAIPEPASMAFALSTIAFAAARRSRG